MVEKEFGKVKFNQVKMEILKRVSSEGPMGEIESWKTAFPSIDFYDLVIPNAEAQEMYDDGSIAGMVEVNWDERTVAEKIFYVAFLNNPCGAEIRYDVIVEDELKITQIIEDPEIIWYMWVSGCFCGEELTEEAMRNFVEKMTDEHQEKREEIDDLDLEQFKVVSLEMKVSPV
jgi:hypothetical protein